jgi:lysozyme
MSDNPLVIDISHWQSGVDFASIKAGGVAGVIHKATESTGYVDDCYAARKSQAAAAGVLWGAYHFLRPGNMVTQAQHFVATAGTIDLYAADHEDSGVSLNALKDFLTEVKAITGKKPVIYSGHVLKEQLDDYDQELAQYPLWLAHYADTPSWPGETWPSWWLWQYTDQGTVAGVDPTTDLDRYDGSVEDLRTEWTGAAPPRPRPPHDWPPVRRIGAHARRDDRQDDRRDDRRDDREDNRDDRRDDRKDKRDDRR